MATGKCFMMLTSLTLLVSSIHAMPLENGIVITSTDCSMLASSVQVMLSKGVKATYVCDPESQVIGVAACHQYGRRNAVLSDGSETSTGIVYTLKSDPNGATMADVAGCPLGDTPIPDEMVDLADD